MDIQSMAIVISIAAVGVAIGGGFWKLGRLIGNLESKIDGIKTNSSAINNLGAKVEELNYRLHSYEKQLNGIDIRIDRMDKRVNGFMDNITKKG